MIGERPEGSRGCLADRLRRLALPDEEERLLPADALDLGRAARTELEGAAEPVADFRRDVDAVRLAGVLEPRREVHRITPDVVAELLRPDHAGHDRAGGDADAGSARPR